MLKLWKPIFDFERELYDFLPYSGPKVNVSEEDTKITFEAELPGLKPEEVEISIEGFTLTIKGKKTEQKKRFLIQERSQSSFSRSFTLPETIDKEKISAIYENGICYISIPKQAKEIPKKIKIEVK